MDTKKKTYSSTRSWKNETTKERKKNEGVEKKTPRKAKKAKNFGSVPEQLISSSAVTV